MSDIASNPSEKQLKDERDRLKTEVDRLEQEEACEEDVLRCTIACSTELGTNSKGCPRAVALVRQILSSRGALNEATVTKDSCIRLHKQICQAMVDVALGNEAKKVGHAQQPFHALSWASSAWFLCSEVFSSLFGDKAITVFTDAWNDVCMKTESKESEGIDAVRDCYVAMVHEVFCSAVNHCRSAVNAVIRPSQIGDVGPDSYTSSEAVLMGMFKGLCSLTEEIYETTRRSSFPLVLQCQILQQMVWYSTAVIVNNMLGSPYVCTGEYGVAFALGLSQMEQWCHDSPFREQLTPLLAPLKEFANVLAIGKCILMEPGATQEAFPSLKPAQFLQIVKNMNIIEDVEDPKLETAWKHVIEQSSDPQQAKNFCETQWIPYKSSPSP